MTSYIYWKTRIKWTYYRGFRCTIKSYRYNAILTITSLRLSPTTISEKFTLRIPFRRNPNLLNSIVCLTSSCVLQAQAKLFSYCSTFSASQTSQKIKQSHEITVPVVLSDGFYPRWKEQEEWIREKHSGLCSHYDRSPFCCDIDGGSMTSLPISSPLTESFVYSQTKWWTSSKMNRRFISMLSPSRWPQ